jgi:hypothetical protein
MSCDRVERRAEETVMLRRAVLAVLVALVVTMACAGSASACNDPTLQAVEPSSAGPGDPVSFTIINTEPGASWQIAINGGAPLASGTATGGYVTRNFTMPDLGQSDTTVSVEAAVTHSDIPGGSLKTAKSLGYRAPVASSAPAPNADSSQPAPPGPPTADQSQPTAQSSPPAAGGAAPHSPVVPRPPHAGKPSGPKSPPTPPRSPVRQPATAHAPLQPARPEMQSTPVRPPVATPEVAATPIPHANPVQSQAERRPSDTSVTQGRRVIGGPRPVVVATGARATERGAADDTAAVLAAVALIALLGGIGRMGLRVRRRSPLRMIPRAPEMVDVLAPDDAIEAELQELLNEEATRREVIKS